MQTLWSRLATQTRLSCGCPSCQIHTAVHGIARRPITAAGKRPKYAYSSTLWYSGIFAAAATTDALVKQRRREQWDKAIAEVKQEINEEEVRDGRLDAERVEGEQIRVENAEAEALFENETYVTHKPIWPANTGAPLIRHNLPPQSIYASEDVQERAERRLWTPKKLRITELTVDRLVLRMLLYLDDIGQLEEVVDSVPESFHPLLQASRRGLEMFLSRTESKLRAVRASDQFLTTHPYLSNYVHPHSAKYFQDPNGAHLSTSSEQLEAMESLLSHLDSNHTQPLSDTLVKICYNLSISTAPPSLTVWNSLLKHLTRRSDAKEPVDLIIDCIHKSNVRMNEETLIHVLDHCIASDDAPAFTRFIGMMRGDHGGLMLARPDISITERGGASRLIRLSEEKVIQNPYPNPKVFEVVTSGVLHFAGFEAALRICQDMGEQGWGLAVRGLIPLLSDCVRRSDWESGAAVWRQVYLLKDKSNRDGKPERIPRLAYVEALKMCLGTKDEELFRKTMGQARRDKWDRERLLEQMKEQETKPLRRMYDASPRNKDNVVSEGRASSLLMALSHTEPFEPKTRGNTSSVHNLLSSAKINPMVLPDAEFQDASSILNTVLSNAGFKKREERPKEQNAAKSMPLPGTGWGKPVTTTVNSNSTLQGAVHQVQETTTAATAAYTTQISKHRMLEREHLTGGFAATEELDEYEAGERPMALNANTAVR
ncbi:hypothetical protein BDV97DRAFT_354877 [Delphinella strobiligena]|nr:hypothetical protein BDV97DRAFT_354877 [Delphinella strobiligena]